MSSRNRAIVRFDDSHTQHSHHNHHNHHNQQRKKQQNSARVDVANNTSDDGITRSQLDQYVRDGVKYLLIVDHRKTPVKRSDLFKAICKNINCSRTQQELILEKIGLGLSRTFGFDLVECAHTNNSYILVNKLSINDNEAIDNNWIEDCQHYRSALLSIILSNILMCGESVAEHDLYKFLAKLGLDIHSKQILNINDELSGVTLKKLLTEVWVRQQYLKFDKVATTESPTHEFSWGFRATQEFSKMSVLKFVSKVYGNNITPDYWRNQYQSALNELQNNGDVDDASDD